MVLVDTSVWIQFLEGHEPYLGRLSRLLEFDQVVGHELVYGELLMGDQGKRQRVRDYFDKMFQAAPVPHWDVRAFVEVRKLQGRGVGWIDVSLLASAIVSGSKLWTADSRLSALADEFGVGYRVRS